MTVPTRWLTHSDYAVCIQHVDSESPRGRLGVDGDSEPDYFWVTFLAAAFFAGAFLAAAFLAGAAFLA
ncbi:hypothetical protein, partial [Mycobacterium tuberculosis]|uniref:hypothetical protein n=1 Tax=Mycobacterium tuberculosis TaxID=1773 RepID=UPI0037C96F7A